MRVEDIRIGLNKLMKRAFSFKLEFNYFKILFQIKSMTTRLTKIGKTAFLYSLGQAYDEDIKEHPNKPLLLPMARISYPVYLQNEEVDVNPAKFSKHVTPLYLQHLIFDGRENNKTLFLLNFDERGECNKYEKKEIYMKHLTQENINLIKIQIIPILKLHFQLSWKCHKTILENSIVLVNMLSHFIHFGKRLEHNNKHVKMYSNLCKGLCHTPTSKEALKTTDAYYKYIELEKTTLDNFIMKSIKESKDKCNTEFMPLVTSWKESGIDHNDIYIEFIHNVMGLNVQWTVLMCRYLENIEKYKDRSTHHILADISPSLAVVSVSKTKKEEHMCPLRSFGKHFFENNQQNYTTILNKSEIDFKLVKSVYEKNEQILIAPGTQIIKHKKFQVFGDGYRRCPGEVLTYMFLETLICVCKNFKITKNENEDKSESRQQLGFNAFALCYLEFTFLGQESCLPFE